MAVIDTLSTPSDSRFVCGIDIGGTFTDCAVVDETGRMVTAKVPSTPDRPAEAFMDALAASAATMGVPLGDLLARCDQLMHGTTVATNAVVQKRGAKVGLVATLGHGEAILHMRGAGRTTGVNIERMLDIPSSGKPEPLVPRALIVEVVERVDCDGDVVVPLDEAQAEAAVRRLLDQGVDAIAISLLWAFLNPDHEQRIKAIIRRLAPDVYVTASSDIAPVMGEYERTVATALNSYVGPVTRGYLRDLSERVTGAGYGRDVLIVESTGGVVPAPRAGEEASLTLGSGPVAGIIGTRFLAEALGMPNVIAVDMGGTSFDLGLVRDGAPVTSDTALVGQYQYHVPNVDVRSIGAGGGSIASVDEISGGLLVGPDSAGAVPGPACYRRGGTEATVTDADLVLGYLDPAFFLGGRMALDRRAAEEAIDRIAEQAGLDRTRTAAGIVKVVEFRMADLIRTTTIERGFDPREFSLFVYGGAGPVHGVLLARELGIGTVVVPMGNAAGVWSALGAATSHVLFVYRQSDPQTAPFDGERLTRAYREMEERGRRELRDQGFSDERIEITRRASIRYRYQIHEVEIEVAAGDIDEAGAQTMLDDFERAYEAKYGKGTGFPAAGFEVTSLKVLAVGRLTQPELAQRARDGARPDSFDSREIYVPDEERFVRAAVAHGRDLRPGMEIAGPAVIELDWTTVVVQPGSRAEVDGLGNLIIRLEENPS
ncbi:MAG: hydantoinase/oxoprolinase family protein [Microbispora sp.]|nr:hydantoinase/oxoprolinase family protein [Microbispora sp.]